MERAPLMHSERKTFKDDQDRDPLHLSAESFSLFAQFITRELGIKMSPEKVTMLKGRLMRRLRVLQIDSLEEYQDYLFASPHAEQERIHFIDAVTTNKTDFFREPQHFDYLRNTVLPAFRSEHGVSRRFTIWCAGCSSGEEPYTQAMVLGSYARQQAGFDYMILATDISTRMLDQAKAAIYPEEIIEPIPAEMRRAFLMRSRDPQERKIRISAELRGKISFHRLNFMDSDYGVRNMFDVIFFRNVMIYFDKATQEAVVNKLCRNLRPGGYLFVGHSESLTGLNIPVVSLSSSIFRKPHL
jgi:chemotaxis protein methyltransferase CheR